MRIIEPYQKRVLKKAKTKKTIWRILLITLVILIVAASIFGIWIYRLPLPKISAKTVTVRNKGNAVALSWPKYGQASVGAVDYGLLTSTKNQKPVPTASVAKIMTAIAILKVKPLGATEQGPTIVLNDKDVALYNQYLAKNGSVALVKSGENISEKQALEAMLLPSANNMADSLAIWAFGSIKNYSTYANTLAKQLGLQNTTITSASGYDPKTVSTASDLVKLGLVSMNDPVISSIVAEKKAHIPVAGTINNVNFLLGHNNIVGVKTGNTDEAGGVYLFAATRPIANGQNTTIVGAIMGAHNLQIALNDSLPLLVSSYKNFIPRQLIKKGDKLAYYDLPWDGQISAAADRDLIVWGWKGSDLKAVINTDILSADGITGNKVGTVKFGDQTANLELNSSIPLPNQSWRLLHRFDNLWNK